IREHGADELERACEEIERVAPSARPTPSSAALDWDGVRALAASGLEIGAHTVGHSVLTHCPASEIARDVDQCRPTTERESRRPVRHFAYCNGYYNDALVRVLRDRGFASAVTTEDRLNRRGADPFRIGRRVVWEGTTRGAFGGASGPLVACALDDAWTALG